MFIYLFFNIVLKNIISLLYYKGTIQSQSKQGLLRGNIIPSNKQFWFGMDILRPKMGGVLAKVEIGIKGFHYVDLDEAA